MYCVGVRCAAPNGDSAREATENTLVGNDSIWAEKASGVCHAKLPLLPSLVVRDPPLIEEHYQTHRATCTESFLNVLLITGRSRWQRLWIGTNKEIPCD